MAPYSTGSLQHTFSSSLPISTLSILILLATYILYEAYTFIQNQKPISGFPLISLQEEKGLGPKESFSLHGEEVIRKGLSSTSGPFQVRAGRCYKIILPNKYVEEIRNHPNLSFRNAIASDFFPSYPGFEPFRIGHRDEELLTTVVRTKLTTSLGLVTDDLVDETTCALHDVFGENEEWKSSYLKKDNLELVARLSSRVFLGADLCRDRRWLDVTKGYSTDAFIASRKLRPVPALLRPIRFWFIPECQRLRKHIEAANAAISADVKRRKDRTQKAMEMGKKSPKTCDAIGWMYEISHGREDINYVNTQIKLSLAAIHTTTESLTMALIDCCRHPEVVAPLREEIIKIVGENGWEKATLYKLRLLDSFLKESQRMNPLGQLSINRLTAQKLELSDGTVIPKGVRILALPRYKDPTMFPEPEKFDVYRFLRQRSEPGMENSFQHVTPTPEHLGFGYGEYACPGRFFASNELKIALCHMLLKYDWRFADGEVDAKIHRFEGLASVDPGTKILFRRRAEEIDL